MAVVADLPTLKQRLGVIGSSEDANLQGALDEAKAGILARGLMVDHEPLDDVQGAMLLTAARLHQRRRSPEGVAGFTEFGVVRIVATDPDIRRLLAPHWDMTAEGVA